MLGLPALSSAAPAAMSTVTGPGAVGVTVAGIPRAVPFQLRGDAVPDDHVLELEAGHRLGEDDRDREWTDDRFGGGAGDRPPSEPWCPPRWRNCWAATLGFPALSEAAPAGTSTVTVPEAAGVIVAV